MLFSLQNKVALFVFAASKKSILNFTLQMLAFGDVLRWISYNDCCAAASGMTLGQSWVALE